MFEDKKKITKSVEFAESVPNIVNRPENRRTKTCKKFVLVFKCHFFPKRRIDSILRFGLKNADNQKKFETLFVELNDFNEIWHNSFSL